MVKIARFSYDFYELAPDLGSGMVLSSFVPKKFDGKKFKSVGGALKSICSYLKTAYHKNDWCYEVDLDCNGNNGWVLHIIVDKKTHKWATEKMISEWRNGKRELVDLLVNVYFENDFTYNENCGEGFQP